MSRGDSGDSSSDRTFFPPAIQSLGRDAVVSRSSIVEEDVSLLFRRQKRRLLDCNPFAELLTRSGAAFTRFRTLSRSSPLTNLDDVVALHGLERSLECLGGTQGRAAFTLTGIGAADRRRSGSNLLRRKIRVQVHVD
jgi:hypothetical protein